jgi:hypothetical protein
MITDPIFHLGCSKRERFSCGSGMSAESARENGGAVPSPVFEDPRTSLSPAFGILERAKCLSFLSLLVTREGIQVVKRNKPFSGNDLW